MNISNDFSGPAWDLSTEYPSLSSAELRKDLERVSILIELISEKCDKLNPFLDQVRQKTVLSTTQRDDLLKFCEDISSLEDEAKVLAQNISTYGTCSSSVDARDQDAKKLVQKMTSIASSLEQALTPFKLFLTFIDDDFIKSFLADEKRASQAFRVKRFRLKKNRALPSDQEKLISALSVDGFSSWDMLYQNLSGALLCNVKLPEGAKKVGIAAATVLLEDPDDAIRKSAYEGTDAAWKTQEESCASILNALSGWRHETYKRRSHTEKVHFLDDALFDARIEQTTLNAMLAAVKKAKSMALNVMKIQAKTLGKSTLEPWDRFAPPPSLKRESSSSGESKVSFSDAIKLINETYSSINPEMSQFLHEMVDKKWIEARMGNYRRAGAYATKFIKTRTPRVYMTYGGNMKNVLTLAHEIGHCFHGFTMRDIPLHELVYPMTLAETASILSETVVQRTLFEKTKNPYEIFKIYWNDAQKIETFLLNIPVRYEFEKAFYEARLEKSFSPQDFKNLFKQTWVSWYEDSIGLDEMFWASKLHFYKANICFYNFPYTFGYLFSLGVLKQRDRLGQRFYQAYKDLLRDTGRMTAEELAKKHLNVDISEETFWQGSLDILTETARNFEESYLAIKDKI